MTRKKVKLAFIENHATRKTTYRKMKKGLLKKVSELSALCGIHACAIIYSPYDFKPDLWPGKLGVEHVISKFQRLQKVYQTKKMLDEVTFMRQRISKLIEQLKRQQIKNCDKEIKELMYRCLWNGKNVLKNLIMANLNDLGLEVERKLMEINRRIEGLENAEALQQVAQSQMTAHEEQNSLVPSTLD